MYISGIKDDNNEDDEENRINRDDDIENKDQENSKGHAIEKPVRDKHHYVFKPIPICYKRTIALSVIGSGLFILLVGLLIVIK